MKSDGNREIALGRELALREALECDPPRFGDCGAVAGRFDVVLGDLDMPGMIRAEVVQKCPKHAAPKGLPVVLLTTEFRRRAEAARQVGRRGHIATSCSDPENATFEGADLTTFSCATIAGDGTVVPILDIVKLVGLGQGLEIRSRSQIGRAA